MRPPQRAVADDDVDRPQVEAWRHVEPSGTNCPRACARSAGPAAPRGAGTAVSAPLPETKRVLPSAARATKRHVAAVTPGRTSSHSEQRS